ncbi:hypothetical protein NLU13_0121 [Sarocladium strictum]|uniref:SWI-SNF chromatin-remodeling complex protein n=1 Tax=Sarocladium strictum TaxID=5046 RepID=A0AA39LAZ5_SARSR|nr:hypothetical protein NLU13_0121 [Sarocladium strictum]
MDGSYNHPFGPGHGPSHLNSPQTPSSATYQTNVNRSKTRKWVEARPQTYDGDDWGTDDLDEEPDSPPHQQQPPVPSSSRLASYGQRTPSSAAAPNLASPPALHIPTQHSAPPAQVAHYPADSAVPAYPQGAPAVADSSRAKSPDHTVQHENSLVNNPVDVPHHTPAAGFPASQTAAPMYAEHTDHFGRVERKNTIRKPVGSAKPPADSTMAGAPPLPEKPNQGESTTPPEDVPTEPSAQKGDESLSHPEDIDRHRLSTSPQLPDVARMSAFGLDLFSGNTKRVSIMAPSPPIADNEPTASVPDPSLNALVEEAEVTVTQQDGANAATSQSTTGVPVPSTAAELEPTAADSTETVASGPTPPEKTDTDVASHMWRTGVPGDQATQEEPKLAPTVQPQEHDVSPISERDVGAAAAQNALQAPRDDERPTALQPTHDGPTIAPLRTPSQHISQIAPATAASGGKEGRSEPEPLQTSVSALVSAEQLESRTPEYSPSDYDPKTLQREATFSTVTSSPVKESDLLRDEIIKSLSPQNDSTPASFPPPVPPKPFSEPTKSGPRESTYTLSGYDSYWAEKDRGAQPTVQEEQEEARAVTPVAEEKPASTPKQSVAEPVMVEAQQASTPVDAEGRRRFSWEMEGEEAATVPVQNEVAARDSVDQESSKVADRVPSLAAKVGVDAPKIEQPQDNTTTSSGISHQVSQASSSRLPVGEAAIATPEPPSPVSDPSERNQAHVTQDRRPSLAEQKSLIRSDATPVAPSPPSGTHPALVPSPTASQTPATQPPLMTFREIMGLPSAQERISKYDEARMRFATIESGLSEWIANLTSSQPDLSNATTSFGGSVAAPSGVPTSIPSPISGQIPPQQPYYQQYLNASSPTVANGPGRSRLGGMSSSGQSHSAFGHSSDKIGTKSKEFMQSAGKMGKGLFSKGKSKLRGTGDKVDASPPVTPMQGKTKSDRRSSWALSLGTRLRTEGMGVHSNANAVKMSHPPIGYSPQPSTATGRLSLSSNRPPAGETLRGPEGPGSRSEPPALDVRHVANEPMPNRGDRAGHNRDVSLPLTLHKDADEPSWDPFNGTPYARRRSPSPGDALIGESNDPDTRVSGDWVVVRRETSVSQGPHHPRTAPEDSGIGMNSQPDQPGDRPEGLKRDPSFGLPMIRRSTTLDFGLKDALGPGEESGKPGDQLPAAGGANANEKTTTEIVPPIKATSSNLEDLKPVDATSAQTGSMDQQPQVISQPNTEGHDRTQGRSQAQAGLPLLQTQNSAQKAVQPPGHWKLEESHLSEPLHQVSRKRSGTDDSQQVTYGLDKEMGITSSSPISPVTLVPRQRSGNQLPPSSAQRYPELFTGAQPQNGLRGRSNSGSNMIAADLPRTQSNEFDIPGVGPPEERGRRKSSSIFREFGNRIARASSRDRGPSVSESRPSTSEILRAGGASETTVGAENNPDHRKKRSSLLLGLRSRPSMELTTHMNDLRPENGPTVIQSQGLGQSASQNALPLPSEDERRSKSMFRTDKLKLRSSRTEKWDSTNEPETGANKNRFSGFGGKVAGLAGAFRRPMSAEQSLHYGQASMAADDFNEEARQASWQQTAPPPAPVEYQESRGRRGSTTAVLSGLLGRSSSHTREQQRPPFGQQVIGENGVNRVNTGRASMDQHPGALHVSSHQQGPPASIRPVGQSPPPKATRKDNGIPTDAGRFEAVSPELSLSSAVQNVHSREDEVNHNAAQNMMGPGRAGSTQEQRPSMPHGQTSDMSWSDPPRSDASPPLGGYYGPHQSSQGQSQMYQPMQQQRMQIAPPQYQSSFALSNRQHPELLSQQSSHQDMLNVPGSRHSSMSLQSSNQGRSSDGQQGSRWRGFKNRISGQLVPQNQDRGGEKGDRMSGSKLFGGFKRNFKQQPGPSVAMHQNVHQSQQWAQHPQQLQGLPQSGPQGPQHMGLQDQPQNTMPPPPPQQQRLSHVQADPRRLGMGPNPYDNYKRQSSTGLSSGHKQILTRDQGYAPVISVPRSPPQLHDPPGHQMQSEKQYDQVPIPVAYGAVSGQAHPLDLDRQMQNYSTSFQYNSPGQSPPPNQWQQGHQQPVMHGQPSGSTLLSGQPSAGHQSGQGPHDFETQQLSGDHGTPTTSLYGTNNASAGRASPQKAAQSTASPHPPSVLPPPPSAAGRPEYPRGDSEVLPPAHSGSITRKPTIPRSGAEELTPTTPVATTQRVNGEESRKSANLSVDIAKAAADKEEDIYDATPRIVQGKMDHKSPEPTVLAQSPASTSAPVPTTMVAKESGGASFAMELENTEEARKRTIRLDSQEEKIYYDPAADDENPTMSATSYPGQEWNPYGEFDYSDLGDETHNESIRRR